MTPKAPVVDELQEAMPELQLVYIDVEAGYARNPGAVLPEIV